MKRSTAPLLESPSTRRGFTWVDAVVMLALLAVAAAVTWWLARTDDSDNLPATTTRLVQPGYYLRDATLEETDDAGRLYLRVATAKADQNPTTQEIALGPVRVDYCPAGTAPCRTNKARNRRSTGPGVWRRSSHSWIG